MTDLQKLLDQIDRLDQEATKGPWHVAPEEDEDGSKFPWAIFGPKNDLWGPQGWDHEHYIQEIPELTIPDAEFIALARTALPAMSKALRAVLYLHPCLDLGDLHEPDYICASCVTINRVGGWEHAKYPCPTVQAITDQMEGDDD